MIIIKPVMFVLTSLFFNKTGNQSLFETVRGYLKHFDVYLITSAYLSDKYFYTLPEVMEKLPDLKVVIPRMRVYNLCKNRHRVKVNHIVTPARSIEEIRKGSMQSTHEIVNQEISVGTIISFHYKAMVLHRSAVKLLNSGVVPQVICAYEIGGVIPALKLKKKVPEATTFAKFQGTVLGPVLGDISNKDIQKKFRLDIAAMKRVHEFDGAIMTNDGTFGDKVLQYFGMKKILFLPNGLATDFVNQAITEHLIKHERRTEENTIRLYTLSRIIPWKRVHLSIEIMNILVNEFRNTHFELKLYGEAEQTYLLFIEKLVSEYHLEEFVKICGPVPYERVPKVHYDNDILLSLYFGTNATNTVYEALYIGNTVITIEDPNLVEIVGKDHRIIYFGRNLSDKVIAKQIAEYLNKLWLQDKGVFCEYNMRSDIMSWDERIEREIEFINSLKRYA